MKTKKPKKTAIAPAAKPIGELVIEQGYGLAAEIDGEYLFIKQRDGGSNRYESVCLSRSELRQVINRFGAWAA